jgi:quercetin dioxygenase-like cupin family protein
MEYKVDFENLNWEIPFEGIRHKTLDQNNIRVRLVEYDRSMPPHWCEKPHYGIVLEGIFEIEFDHETVRYGKGDGLFLPAGRLHRHRARTITDKALIFFIETLSNEVK